MYKTVPHRHRIQPGLQWNNCATSFDKRLFQEMLVVKLIDLHELRSPYLAAPGPANNPEPLEQLKQNIRNEINEIPRKICQNVIKNVLRRVLSFDQRFITTKYLIQCNIFV